MFSLGQYYADGFEFHPDHNPEEAAKWLRKAAQLGVEEADEMLAEIQYRLDDAEDANGLSNEPAAENGAETLRKFRQAAEQGDAQAAYSLGFACQFGLGVEKSPTQAFYWYREAASFGDVDATANVAACYANGFGVERDPVEAARWLRRAAELGDFEARRRLEKLD